MVDPPVRRPPPSIFGAADLAAAVTSLGVTTSDALFVHSSLRGALRMEGRTGTEKMATIGAGLVAAVPEGTLLMPTFTYSFCEDREFDVERSPSRVGALGEWFRALPDVRRTRDPIFSCALRGALPEAWEQRLLRAHDVDCFGEHSVFAYLRERRAKLLFLGVGFQYATYVHHVEQRLRVPYRYPKPFSGVVVDGGRRIEVTATYLVRRLDGSVEPSFERLAAALTDAGAARSTTLPDGPALLLVDVEAIEPAVRAGLEGDPRYLLR